MKKGQISIFIIVGLILIAVFGGLWMIAEQMTIDTSVEDVAPLIERNVIDSFIQECLEQSTDTVLNNIIQEGGMGFLRTSNVSNKIRQEYELNVGQGIIRSYAPYYYRFNGVQKIILLPTKERLNSEIAYRISSDWAKCLRGFEDFPQEEYMVTMKPYGIQANITDTGAIRVFLRTNFILEREGFTAMTGNFTYEVQSNLGIFLNITQEIMNEINETGNNSFPDIFALLLTRQYNMSYFNATDTNYNLTLLNYSYYKISDKDSKYTVIMQRPSIIPRFRGLMDRFPVVYQFNWTELYKPPANAVISQTIPLGNWILNETYAANRINNFTGITWDITSYFPGFTPPGPNPSDDTHFYNIYSENFDILYTGKIYPYYFPNIGTNEMIVRAFELTNAENEVFKKFTLNVAYDQIYPPEILFPNTTVGFSGFTYYERVLAYNLDGTPVKYFMNIPPELRNMPCGGYMYIVPDTGEIAGYITAPPGNYTLTIAVNGTQLVAVNTTLIVGGNYNFECR